MEFVQKIFHFICIILSLFSGPLTPILNGKKAKWWNTFVITVIGVMNVCVLAFVVRTGEPYVYRMGHFSAPWGNEDPRRNPGSCDGGSFSARRCCCACSAA